MKKTILTGATGFIGRHIYSSSPNIITLGRDKRNNLQFDLCKDIPILPNEVTKVIHCMGAAHKIPKTKKEKEEFYEANLEATKNLTSSISLNCTKFQQFIYISTVAVYGVDKGENISELHNTNPKTIYGKTKLLAENHLTSWAKDEGINLLILRLPLVVGMNPKGNLQKLINAIKRGLFFLVDKGRAKKSMVHVNDIVNLITSDNLFSGIYNLTDGYHPSINEVSEKIRLKFNKSKLFSFKSSHIKFLSKLGDIIPLIPLNSSTFNNITNSLTFDDTKARKNIGWKSSKVLEQNDWLN